MKNPDRFAKLFGVTHDSFDYIIAGGGMAGLTLAFYLDASRLRDQKTLIIDRDRKTANDHTYCFWQKEKSAFEETVFRRWRGVWFHGAREFSEFLSLGDYEYKMIRAADFYEFVRRRLSANPNFTFLQANIEKAESNERGATVKTSAGEFRAREFVFDSFTRKTYDDPRYQNLWQHFAGWTIETAKAVFKPDEPTLFDFRVAQKNECRFVYVLPFSANRALIEFTVFSDNILEQSEYEFALREYLAEVLQIENYRILDTESGVIPMSDEPHAALPASKIIRIGTSGGYVKPSTGYSFTRTQRNLSQLVANLETSRSALGAPRSRWKSYLDSVLLNVLKTKKHSAADVFTHLFARNGAEQVFKFLDEDTDLAEDLRIMQTVPLAPFTRAAIETGLKTLRF